MKWKGKPLKPSGKLALGLSFLVYPGAGQAGNRQYFKAALVALLFTTALGLFFFKAFRALWLVYGAATSLRPIPPIRGLLEEMIAPFVATVLLYFGAAWEAWWVGRGLERKAARAEAEAEAEAEASAESQKGS